ncbi:MULTISPECIES: heat-inducible transcriptional repressor HrcA [Vagococcus]|uniref:heat-inducible transcriptional repressor HrcA n=1 Tax=Vagococcus TaxID=2737 RepID=UPI000E4DFB21|nr:MULTISPECIES: heat-inducible transcriptional repressor HrcA [Vagococcus]RHH69571.1 heat-inducible transcription repressor HrcA [Vagococcus sp. AM17-17]
MLSSRQEHILQLLVQLYTETGQPVGSKTLMNSGITVSSATIRNELSKLEDFGLIQKMHTSSGRIPSMQGYRYYVDHLMDPSKVSSTDVQHIKRLFNRKFNATNEIIEWSANILSELTSYTAFSLGPEVKERRLTGFQIVPLNARQLMAIIVIDQGYVESQVFSIPHSVSTEDIEKMIRIINDRLLGETLLTVYHKLRTEIPLVLQRYFSNSSNILYLFEDVFNQAFDEQIYVGGGMNLLSSEAITNPNEFQSVYSLISDTDKLTELLISDTDEKIDIKIGEELNNELLQNMSLVTGSYDVFQRGKGLVAVLGPANMSYSKLLGVMDVLTDELSRHLETYYRHLENSGE